MIEFCNILGFYTRDLVDLVPRQENKNHATGFETASSMHKTIHFIYGRNATL